MIRCGSTRSCTAISVSLDLRRLLGRTESADRLDVAFVSPPLERDAWAWLRRRDEREYSFVAAMSLALLRSLRIREAFAFDGDFAAAGFVELRPS